MSLRRVAWVLVLLTVGAASRVGAWPLGDRVRGEGPVREERRAVSGVHDVELATIGTLRLEQGDSTSLYVSAQENLLEYLETDVRSGTLVIRARSGVNLDTDKPVEYRLTVPRLDEIVLSSAGDAEFAGWKADRLHVLLQSSGDLNCEFLDCGELYVELQSAGDMDCDSLACKKLFVELQSSGGLTLGTWSGDSLQADLESSGDCEILDGRAQYLDVQVSSSGDFLASRLQCREAEASTSSSGSIELNVTERLHARSSSSGDVIYNGSPQVDARSTSSGDIVQRRR